MIDLTKNSLHTCEITGYNSDGVGLCRIDTMVCFVKGSVRGDVCLVRVVKVLKNCLYGIIDQLITPSPHRIEPQCPHFPRCGGCDLQQVSYEEELHFKQTKVSEAMSRIGGFTPPDFSVTPSPDLLRYRNKAQFPVGLLEGAVKTGFFQPRSHTLVPVDDCLLQPEEANLLAHTVAQWAQCFGIAIYDEATKKGALRHIYVRKGENTLQLCIVSAKKKLKYTEDLIERCRKAVPGLTSIVLNLNGLDTNAILGDHTTTLWGDSTICGKLCGNVFDISPKAFYQINTKQTEQLYNRVLDYAQLDGSQTVIDLYCGIGTISLYLARHAKEVWGIELVPEAIENARTNGENNGIENAQFICNDAGNGAGALIAKGITADVLVVDPPRKGMDQVAIDAILQLAPQRLVYVSCDCATMARDAKLLCSQGYRLEALSAFDMFPRTSHVEVVVLMSKVR